MVPWKSKTPTPADLNANDVPSLDTSRDVLAGNGEVPVRQVKEVLYENEYYDVSEWIKRHPGGRVIEFYVQSGEDATIAINQFHQRSSKKVMSIMGMLRKRPATKIEMGSISPAHKSLNEDFMKLTKELIDEGLFTPSMPNVIGRLVELGTYFAIGMYLTPSANIYLRILGILSLTMMKGRVGWLQHEGGHHSLTGNSNFDRFLQSSTFGLGYGLSGTWWRSQHNRHHAMPQRIQRDVDLETLPFLAFNKAVVRKPEHGKSMFIRYQAFLFLTIDTMLISVLWKYYLHPRYAIKKRAYMDLTFMALHLGIVYHVGLVSYVIIMWLAAVYFLGNFSLSHTHLPVTNEPLHWVQYGLLHTTNISPSFLCDWWMGYLNYQIEHHLFPTMPQFRLSKISPKVQALAISHGIPYRCIPYMKAVAKSLTNLHQVSKEFNH